MDHTETNSKSKSPLRCAGRPSSQTQLWHSAWTQNVVKTCTNRPRDDWLTTGPCNNHPPYPHLRKTPKSCGFSGERVRSHYAHDIVICYKKIDWINFPFGLHADDACAIVFTKWSVLLKLRGSRDRFCRLRGAWNFKSSRCVPRVESNAEQTASWCSIVEFFLSFIFFCPPSFLSLLTG